MSPAPDLLPAWSKITRPTITTRACDCGACCAWRVAMMHPKARRRPSSVLKAAFGLN